VLATPAACAWIGGTEREALLALRALHRLSLVTHDGSTVAMHALVQRAVLDCVPQQALPDWRSPRRMRWIRWGDSARRSELASRALRQR